jgi:NAD(P)-dependent dehydrogenase (short-subunit alcohol dehydrogenase family)
MNFDLANKVVLITGAGGLLGPYHARACLEFGASVVLLDRNYKNLKEAVLSLNHYDKNKIYFYECDVSNEEDVMKVQEKLINNNVHVNVLVNNAANNPAMMKLNQEEFSNRFEEFDIKSIDDDIKSAIHATLICSKIFGSNMALKKEGSIINVASDLAIQAPDQRVYIKTEIMEDVRNFKPISYSVVKSSILGITKYLSTYWGHNNVRCNTLIPGAVFNNQPEDLVNNVIKRVPLRRWADVKDYQGALVFLASEASSYMTGQELIIDGGRSVW